MLIMKRLTALLLCLIMLFALTACSKDESGLRKVTLNEVTRSVFYAPLYVACSRKALRLTSSQAAAVTPA